MNKSVLLGMLIGAIIGPLFFQPEDASYVEEVAFTYVSVLISYCLYMAGYNTFILIRRWYRVKRAIAFLERNSDDDK